MRPSPPVYTITDDDALVKVQKTTANAVGGPFAFTGSNVIGIFADITTTTANQATPAAPVGLPVTALGTAVTFNESPPIGWAFVSATCTDANASITGNGTAIVSNACPSLFLRPMLRQARTTPACSTTGISSPT